MINFTNHAEEKFKVLRNHGFAVTKRQVLATVNNPDSVDYSRLPLLIAQRKIDKQHVLRVVYKGKSGVFKIITFYPGRAKKYL